MNKQNHRIFLTPGLGNTLFQLAHAKHDLDFETVTFLRTVYHRSTLATLFNWGPHRELINLDEKKVIPTRITDIFMLACLFVLKKITSKENVSISFGSITWHFGYYQTKVYDSLPKYKKYLQSIVNIEIDDKFDYQTKENKKINILNDNVCVIHTRQGDFPDGHRIELDYYLRILKKIKGKYHDFLVIGVGAEKISQYLRYNGINNVSLLKDVNEETDFNVIYHCKNIVLSNSTFCFWPVYLGVQKIAFIDEVECFWPFLELYNMLHHVKLTMSQRSVKNNLS